MFRLLVIGFGALISGVVQAGEINVYAAASLTDTMKEIGASYRAKTGQQVVFNFAASSLLARQIEEGAPADIFFSADEAQMDQLEKNGRVEAGSRRDLLANALVIVAPIDSRLELNSPADLRQVSRIAVGDPKFVPIGVYTRGYLEKAGVWHDLEGKILPTENVRAGLAVVESGNADVAFVYATDAGVSSKVKVVFRVPPDQSPPIRYPVALVKESRRKPEAEEFLKYLTSDEATKVFKNFGFIVML